ncbi:hypothetical protein LTS18_013280 [Coniosporium uncinatum]|uniref:Uncharacterized protein n=1 Tax=Coniosporium uncinatum TaxID=93489 RepID=A0ACC3D924_9PEZI|nr:hypothetical protein LTS18_013280 [Coniosporium uncinatum]
MPTPPLSSLTNRPTTPSLPSSHADTTDNNNSKPTPLPPTELPLLLASMRKLRESLLATSRSDSFARRVYIFITRACILARNWEGYQPALNHLLGYLHAVQPLEGSEVAEFVGYKVLDLACRVEDLGAAFEVRARFGFGGAVAVIGAIGGGRSMGLGRVDQVLRALVGGNWVLFHRMRRAVDGYQRALMEFAEGEIRVHTLKCLGRSYITVDRKFVEMATAKEWKELVAQGVGWELMEGGETVVIKRVRSKTATSKEKG